MIAALTVALLLLAGPADAGTSLRPLQQERSRAEAAAAAARSDRDTQARMVLQRARDLQAATAQLATARSPAGYDTQKLAAAMDALARAKAGHDNAVARERAAMVGAVQADAADRAARQALTDAVNQWSAEGDALVRAAGHAAAGDVVRSAHDHAACLDRDCSPISAREHAALVVIGAVGPVFELKEWPPDAANEMTLLPPATPQRTIVRALRDAVAAATRAAQEAQTATDQYHAPVAERERDAALQALLDAYFRPRGTQSQDAVTQAADAYEARARDMPGLLEVAIVTKAREDLQQVEARRDRMLDFFADVGRATQRAALLAGRGYMLTANGNTLSACRAKTCAPTAGVEAAAFAVIGATTPGVEQRVADLVELTADRRWVFRLPN